MIHRFYLPWRFHRAYLATKPEEFSVRFDETEESTHEQMQCHRDFQESGHRGMILWESHILFILVGKMVV